MVAESKRLSGRLAWFYQARRVATQTNIAGGAIKVDISLAVGQVAQVVSLEGINSGTNDVLLNVNDEDNAEQSRFNYQGSGAGVTLRAPTGGTTGAANNSVSGIGFVLGPGQKLSSSQTAAGAQNDTHTVAVSLLLFNKPTEPTWSKARSTNQADVTLAESTISAANMLQQVMV